MPPKLEIFITSYISNPKIRSGHEFIHRAFPKSKYPDLIWYDVASDDSVKALWKQRNEGNPELPMVCVDGKRLASLAQVEEAVEFGEIQELIAKAAGGSEEDKALVGMSAGDLDKLEEELSKK